MITEDQIVRQLYQGSNKKVAMKDIDIIVKNTFQMITEHLKSGEKVYISDFGTFSETESIRKQFVRIKKTQNKK
jgi:nucleoid DNA-binding protein